MSIFNGRKNPLIHTKNNKLFGNQPEIKSLKLLGINLFEAYSVLARPEMSSEFCCIAVRR